MIRKKSGIINIIQPYIHLLFFAFLSIAILIPLLKPGYVLTLDSTQIFMNPISRFFGPDQGVLATSAGIPFDVLNFIFSYIFPPWIFEKVLLFGIFFFAGLGAYRLVGAKGIGSYFAGVLYAINPFTYIRFMAGQWGLLWAYAIIPFGVIAFLELIDKGGTKNAVKLAIVMTLAGLLDISGFFLLILVFVVFLVVRLSIDIRKTSTRSHLWQIGKALAISAGMFLLLNLYWIIPILTARGTLLSQIGQSDLFLFAPHSTSTFGTTFDVASLWGFWRSGYLVTSNFIPFWWAFFVIILFLVVYGALFQRTQQRWITLSFVITGIIALLLAVGAASNLTYKMFDWLWLNMPFFKGFRDSQQFVALLCLTYAVLGGLGVNFFIEGWDRWQHNKTGVRFLAIIFFIVILVNTFPIIVFHGQLNTTDYPKVWYDVNEYLNEDTDNFNVLFLPWHEYIDFSWLPNEDKDLSNPAQQFFDKPVIAGDNMEAGGIYSQSTNPISKYVEFLLSNADTISNLGELLAPLNVKYIILVDEADYQNYDFLYHQKDLSLVMDKSGIILLKNDYTTAKTYAVDSVIHVQSLDDYLKLSQTQDVMEHVYVIGNGQDIGNTDSTEPLDTTENSPISYQIGTTLQNYTVFTVTQDVSTENWEYNGQKAVMSNLGFMPVFNSSPHGGKVVYERFFNVYLPGDIVSFLAFIGMVVLYIRKPKAKIY